MALNKEDKQFIIETIQENNKLIFSKMDEKIDGMDEKINGMDEKIDRLEEKMDKRFSEFKIWILQNFATKGEVEEIVDRKLVPIKRQISGVQDAVASLDSKFTDITMMNMAAIDRLQGNSK